MGSNTKQYLITNWKALLEDFSEQVKEGRYTKMPYINWREFNSVKPPERFYFYTHTPSESEWYASFQFNDRHYTFNAKTEEGEDSFGAFLLDVGKNIAHCDYARLPESKIYEIKIPSSAYPSFDYNDTIEFAIQEKDYSSWLEKWNSIISTPTNISINTDAPNNITINTPNNTTIDNTTNKKENTKMNDMFNFDFGPASGFNFRMSPYGLAVRTEKNGWVAYNTQTNELMDVNVLNFDMDGMIYKMPVALAAIQKGDILMHCGKPVFVRGVGSDTVQVVDYANASVSSILPVKSPFGFNFFTKVVSLMDFQNINASSENPFGNMLPFLMMKNSKHSSDERPDVDPMVLMFLMNSGNANFMQNPMMMYLLLSKGENSDMLPFLLLTGMGASTSMTSGQTPAPSSNPANA